MSRQPMDNELELRLRGLTAEEILSDLPEEPSEAQVNGARISESFSALAAMPEEAEDGVRIYQPRKDNRQEQERLAKLWGETPRAEEPEEEAPEVELEEEEELQPERPARPRRESGFLTGLLSRFSRRQAEPEAESEEPEGEAEPLPKEDLPSFEELLWGKKTGPVRILEEEDEDEPESAPPRREERRSAVRPAAEPVRAPEPEPEEEISLEEILGGSMSVNDILSDYWTGVTEPEDAPTQTPTRSRRERRIEEERARQERIQAERTAKKEARRAARAPAAAPAETPRPVQPQAEEDEDEIRIEIPATPLWEPSATPLWEPEPEPEPVVKEEASSGMSVAEILSDFWSNYSETEETPEPRESAPRSRREAARLREEAASVPPTEAAPSAADKERPANRRRAARGRKQRPAAPEEEDSPSDTGAAEPRPLSAPEAQVPAEPEPPAPPKREEASAPFAFLRRQSSPAKAPREIPTPSAEPEPPAPAPASPRREIIDEDVEFGAMSVEDIIAEYKDILAAMPQEPAPGAAAPAEPAPTGGSVSRMEREARSFIDQMKSENFASIREEAAYDKPKTPPAEAEAPRESGRRSDELRRLLDQEPATADAPAAPPAGNRRGMRLPSDEIDPRFNLNGERKSAMVFGDKELDLSADENYVPPKAADNVGFHWVAGEEELPEKPVEKRPLFRRGKKAAPAPAEPESEERTEGFDDRKRPSYAPDKDYEPEEGDGSEANPFPSFGQYLSGLFSGILVRLFGARRRGVAAAGTMEDETEDLGPELSPAAASKYYGSFVTSLRLRMRIGLVLLAVMAWIALGLPVTGALRSVQVAAGMVLAIQLVILLLGLDVVTSAAINLARGRFGADSLALLCCVLTSLDAMAVCMGVLGRPHMPLCLVSSASFLGVLMSSLLSARGLRKALRVPAIGKRCYGVTAEAEVKGSGLTLLKSLRPPKGFVRRTEEAAPDETAFLRVSPLLALLAVLMTLIVAIAKHAYSDFLYILTALLCPAVPLAALLCFALPYLFGSLRIFHSGAAVAGWSGISDIGRSDNLIVTDRDLFPEGSVEIDTVRIFAEVEPETIISYAGTMICASSSDLAPCFAELMEKNGCPMRRVEGFEYLTGGGMKGVIDGSVILCGGVDLMRLMNVRVPFRLVGKTTVLLAVDGILCGIFNMKYEGQPQVRKALVGLIRSNRHPIFAIRDFLVTPEMLSGCFDVATDGYDFPPYVDRFAISEAEPTANSKLAAVVCREGLGPLVHMADTGRSMYMTVRVNLVLTVFAAVLGVFIAFFRLLTVGTVGSGFLLLFLLLWLIPVLGISVFLRF